MCGASFEKASMVDVGVRLAKLEHLSLKKLSFCSGRVLIYVHPSFYRSLKLWFPLDVGGLSRDGRVITELGTGSLGHAIGILTPENFLSYSRHWEGKWVKMALNLASLNVRRLRDPSKYGCLLGELSNICVDVAVQETHFICAADSRCWRMLFFQHTVAAVALGSLW